MCEINCPLVVACKRAMIEIAPTKAQRQNLRNTYLGFVSENFGAHYGPLEVNLLYYPQNTLYYDQFPNFTNYTHIGMEDISAGYFLTYLSKVRTVERMRKIALNHNESLNANMSLHELKIMSEVCKGQCAIVAGLEP